MTVNKRLLSASRGWDQGTGQSTVASTRSVNKPGTRVDSGRLDLGGVVSGSVRCARRCTIVRAHGERREKRVTQSQQEADYFCKRRNSLAPVIKRHAIHPHSHTVGFQAPQVPASKRKAFPKTRGWGASTQAHHTSCPNSQPPRVPASASASIVQTLDGPCFATIRSNPLGQSRPRRVIRSCGCYRSHRVRPSGVCVFV